MIVDDCISGLVLGDTRIALHIAIPFPLIYHDIVTKITNGHSKCKAHTATNQWKQRVQSSYVNVYSG